MFQTILSRKLVFLFSSHGLFNYTSTLWWIYNAIWYGGRWMMSWNGFDRKWSRSDWGTIPGFAWRDQGKPWITPIMISGFTMEIWIEHLLDRSLECCPYTTLFGRNVSDSWFPVCSLLKVLFKLIAFSLSSFLGKWNLSTNWVIDFCKVVSRPNEVIEFYQLLNPSGHSRPEVYPACNRNDYQRQK